jgi:hypothetical protein
VRRAGSVRPPRWTGGGSRPAPTLLAPPASSTPTCDSTASASPTRGRFAGCSSCRRFQPGAKWVDHSVPPKRRLPRHRGFCAPSVSAPLSATGETRRKGRPYTVNARRRLITAGCRRERKSSRPRANRTRRPEFRESRHRDRRDGHRYWVLLLTTCAAREERVGLYSCSCDALIKESGCGSQSQHVQPWLHRNDRLEWRWPS